MIGQTFCHATINGEGAVPVPIFFTIGDQAVVVIEMVHDGLEESIAVGDGLAFWQNVTVLRVDPCTTLLGDGLNPTVFLQRLEDAVRSDSRQLLLILVREQEAGDRVTVVLDVEAW